MASKPVNQLATGVMAELYKAVIGPLGQDHYLRQFSRFDAQGKAGATWHWPAYWSTLNWLIFRRMWGWALAYVAALLGLALVIFGVGKLVFNYSDSTGLLLFLLFLTAAFVLPGLYANAWYYNYCSEKISAALRHTPEDQDVHEVLAGQASSRRRWFGLAATNVAVLALVTSVVIFVLNFGPEGIFLAQMKRTDQVAGQWASVRQPLSEAASVLPKPEPEPVPVASPAPMAAVPASLNVPARMKAPELAMVGKTDEKAVANTDKLANATQSAPLVAAATEAGSRAQPERTDAQAPPQAKAGKARRAWFVQVGAFAQEANAQKVRTRVEATGLRSAAEPADTPAGHLVRVRVGPFDSKSEARKAALRIKALDLPAVLVRQ